MTDKLLIRTGQAADADVLAQFNIAMALETEGKHLDPTVVIEGVRTVIENPDHGFYVVAVKNNEVAASLLVTFEWSDWRAGQFWWIQSVYVRPACRRQGLLRRLYAHVKAQAERQQRVCGLRLYAEQSNHTAQQAYRALGMEATAYRVFEEML